MLLIENRKRSKDSLKPSARWRNAYGGSSAELIPPRREGKPDVGSGGVCAHWFDVPSDERIRQIDRFSTRSSRPDYAELDWPDYIRSGRNCRAGSCVFCDQSQQVRTSDG